MIKILFKGLLFSIAISLYFITALPFLLTAYIFPHWTRRILTRIVAFYARICLRTLQVKVVTIGKIPETIEGLYVISNHMGFLDILSISSIIPVCYVTSKEMQYTPILGQICTVAGCVYMHNEIKTISKVLENKVNIMVFPEAKSTNGDNVVMFRRGLFSAPVRVHATILPLTINYLSLSGQKVTKENRDSVFWYDDMSFATVFFKILAHSEITVEITIHPLLKNYPDDSTEVANQCHAIVSSAYRGISV